MAAAAQTTLSRLALASAFAVFTISGPASGPSAYTWWIANPLDKVRPSDSPPERPAKRAELFAARNEFEPFQIVLRAETGDLAGVDVDGSDLRSADGGEISRSNLTIYFEPYLNLDRPSSIEGG